MHLVSRKKSWLGNQEVSLCPRRLALRDPWRPLDQAASLIWMTRGQRLPPWV